MDPLLAEPLRDVEDRHAATLHRSPADRHEAPCQNAAADVESRHGFLISAVVQLVLPPFRALGIIIRALK